MLDRRVAAMLRIDFEHLDLSLLSLCRLIFLLDWRWRLRAGNLLNWVGAFFHWKRLVGIVLGEIGRLDPVLRADEQLQIIIFRHG